MRIEKALLISLLVFVITCFTYQAQSAIAPEFKLAASDGNDFDDFGHSVSISGDRCIIGSRMDDDNGENSGSAYIFDFNGTNWIEQQKLIASDGATEDRFGRSVSISGNRCVIGASGDDDNGENSGSAYIFDFNGTAWIEHKLTASDGTGGDYFGFSVSISGDRCIVGAYRDDDFKGSAYIFKFNGATWVEQQKLIASDRDESDDFGFSVSIDDDHCIIGSRTDDDNGANSGSAYIFDFNGTDWVEQQKLMASDGANSDSFGESVSISGNRCVIGASGDDDNGDASGSAYIFDCNGTNWIEQTKLTASDGAICDYFGFSVSISGDRCIVGAYGDDDNGFNSGSAYIFKFNNKSWIEQAKLAPSDAAIDDRFGYSVNISGDRCIIGSIKDDDNGSNSGSAYVFHGEIPFYKAFDPYPEDGAIAIDPNVLLFWHPGKDANSHDVYLGTDYNDVNDSNIFSTEYVGNFDITSFDPCGLDTATWYYWRVDEVNDANPDLWKGNTWSFRTIAPIIELSATQFVFYFPPEGGNPDDQTLYIHNGGVSTLHWTIDYDCNWLTVDPNSGSSTGDINEVVLSVDVNGLDPNYVYFCELTVSDPNAENSPQIAEVYLIRDCFPSDHADYNEWILVGKPDCWCAPCTRQCHGDADCAVEGKELFRVGSYDLGILKDAWHKTDDQLTGNDACADFDHAAEGKENFRVGSYDLGILKDNWHKLDGEIPADCL